MQARAITEDKPCEAFWPAQRKFEELVKNLQSERCRGMTHDELEEEVTREGRELLRRMLQGHLDWRGPGPVSGPVVGADGVERTQRRELGRKLNSVFGTVVVSRFAYGAARTTSLFPLEAELNMPKESYSLGVRYKVAKAAAEVSFDSVVTNVADAIGYTVPKRQLEQLAARASVDFDEFYAQRPLAAHRHALPVGRQHQYTVIILACALTVLSPPYRPQNSSTHEGSISAFAVTLETATTAASVRPAQPQSTTSRRLPLHLELSESAGDATT